MTRHRGTHPPRRWARLRAIFALYRFQRADVPMLLFVLSPIIGLALGAPYWWWVAAPVFWFVVGKVWARTIDRKLNDELERQNRSNPEL